MKNPRMSLWLSAANSWTGAARGGATAEMRQAQAAAIEEMSRRTLAFWTGGATARPAARKRRSTR